MQSKSKDGDNMHKVCINPKCGAPTKFIPTKCPRTEEKIYQYRIIYQDEDFPEKWDYLNLYSHICFSHDEINKIIEDAFNDIKLYYTSWNGCMCNQIWYSIKDYILDTDERFINVQECKVQAKFTIDEKNKKINYLWSTF